MRSPRLCRVLGSVFAACLSLGGALSLAATPAGATTVSTEAQLRTAFTLATETQIDLANDITLIDCAAGDLDRNSATALTLDGHGFTITQTCAGQRVMTQMGAGALTLTGVTITGGDGTGAQNTGGGVFAAAPLVIESSTVTGNRASGGSGGLGGGVFGDPLTVRSSTISDNTAGRSADGSNGGLGGAIATGGSVDITDSTISGNHSEGGTGIFTGQAGAIFTNSPVTVTRSTIVGNVAEASTDTNNGGNGGAIVTNNAVTLVNSTVTGNQALGNLSGNGGVAAGGGQLLTLIYTTVVGNSAAQAANVGGDTRSAFGTVVALPLGGGENCAAPATTVTSEGWNFSDDASCAFTNVAQGDRQEAGDPLLGPLADNGGPTLTMLPASDSPLLEQIPADRCGGPDDEITTDQRGEPRPGFALCDIGAVELQPEPPLPGPQPVVLEPTFTG